jgi:hypothetical protein
MSTYVLSFRITSACVQHGRLPTVRFFYDIHNRSTSVCPDVNVKKTVTNIEKINSMEIYT